ncbi:MAG: TonB-dependent receptor [Verrucomicrobiota bacterium JB022]|nr:TonB-dependent receptor [Verrucomicrobiota bacterium JB022]
MNQIAPWKCLPVSVLTLGLPFAVLAQAPADSDSIAPITTTAQDPAATPAAPTPPPATTSTTPDPDMPVYELEAFAVNAGDDVGYTAVDSLAGGRINTPLKLTPSSVSSLTSVFIEDLGITTVRDALKWSPNVVPTDQSAGRRLGAPFQDWSFNYRSAGAGQQGGPGPTRNYFSFYQNADSYNVDRIEFLRGPNSIVFGLGTVGGTLAIYTKRAQLNRDFTTLTGILDSNGGARFELDTNQRLTEQLAVRVNAVADDFKGWQENDNGEFRAATVAFMYRPTARTSITFEAEYADRERTLFGTTIGDEVSGWDGQTNSATWGAAPTGGAVDATQPIQNAGGWGDWLTSYPVYIPGQDPQIQPWAGGFASNTSMPNGVKLNYAPHAGFYPEEVRFHDGTDWYSTDQIPVLPDDDWSYGSGVADTEYKDFTLTVEHKFNENFEGTVAVYRYEDNVTAKSYEPTDGAAIDINQQLPNGQPNPNYGKAFADFFLSQQDQSRTVTEARVQLNYRFGGTFMDKRWDQLFSASAAYKELEINAHQYLGFNVAPADMPDTSQWQQHLVWGRLYLDNPNQLIMPEQGVYYAQQPIGYWYDFDDTFKLKDFAFLSHTRLFDESLSILAGVRYDTYTEDILEYRRDDGMDRFSKQEGDGTTYSVGGIYYYKFLGLFANYSQNIQPPNPGSQPLLSGERPDPEEGSGHEFGVRISTEDHKYYLTITRYDTQSEGRLIENPVGLRGIWDRYNDATNPGAQSPIVAYSDTTSVDVKGWEFEMTANPTRNLRLQASYAKPTAEVVDYYPDSRAYFDANIDTWNAGVQNASSPQAAEDLQNQIDNVRDALDQAVPGAIVSGSVKYTASFFATYTFLDDQPLDGLSIGAGMSLTGRRYAGVYDGRTYWGDDVSTTDMVIAYETEIRNLPVRFALNIDNVFDRNDPIVTDYHYTYVDRSGDRIASGWYMQAPRTFKFTARVTF